MVWEGSVGAVAEVGAGLGLQREEGNSMAMVEKRVLSKEDCKGLLMRKTRGAKRVLILLEEFFGMGKLGFR